MPPKRYFDDERSAKPGVLSDELRAALNLSNDKLPAWIYKMRILGYPPGWLQQADISNSSLQLFDDSSQAQRSATTSQVQEQSFNPECFIEFPGFNAPVPEGVKDHCEVLGMPPMQVWQQLNYVKQTIQPPKPVSYKRIKLSDSGKKNGTLSIDDDDDEIQIIEPSTQEEKAKRTKLPEREREEGEATDSDDDIIALNSSTEDAKPKVQPNSSVLNLSTTIIEEIPRSQSPNSDSIIIVSARKSNNQPSTSSSPSASSSSPSASSTTQPSKDSIQQEESFVDQQSISEKQSNEDKKSIDDKTPKSPHQESSTTKTPSKSPSIKLIAMGSPTPADINTKKPPLEKFAVGMGELIYFENLPTSTGVFDKMRHVIHKVREKLSK